MKANSEKRTDTFFKVAILLNVLAMAPLVGAPLALGLFLAKVPMWVFIVSVLLFAVAAAIAQKKEYYGAVASGMVGFGVTFCPYLFGVVFPQAQDAQGSAQQLYAIMVTCAPYFPIVAGAYAVAATLSVPPARKEK